jgi:hypothetical protein
MSCGKTRLLSERSIEGRPGAHQVRRPGVRPVRSVTVNLAESPLGWLFARGHVSLRQYEAGERLRSDWARSSGTASHNGLGRGTRLPRPRRLGVRAGPQRCADARRRFEAAIANAGPGLADILWRVVCAGEGMRDAETALGWPARAGKLVLCFALDRIADYYRLP